jgi:hypothetical protein
VSALAIAGAATLTTANAQGVGVQVGPIGAGLASALIGMAATATDIRTITRPRANAA